MRLKRAFTLVEILIVVVILGILAAIVVPQFANATEQATKQATVSQLTKIREALGVYFVRNGNIWPEVAAGPVPEDGSGPGTWGQILSAGGDYMKKAPRNKYVNEANATTIVFGTNADSVYDPSHGWIYNPSNGDVWAGGFDANDNPLPH